MQLTISRCFVLLLSVLADRSYYGAWTFPPFRFLHFNIAQSLAVFYGKNRWDYYLTEGIPLLLTTSLPFAVIGIYRQTFRAFTTGRGISLDSVAATATSTLGWVTVFMTVCLSLISHKEIRFLYPALPALHLISASPLSNFTKSPSRFKKLLIAVLFSVNLLIGVYLTQIHQRGVLDVLRYLRSQHESRFQIQTGQDAGIMTVAFLMPCHSTPWRSHLIYPSIDAWALTCEPPLHVPLRQREGYLDEADQFYADPAAWFKVHMGDSDSFAKGQAKHAARNDLRTASSGAATLQPAFHDDSGIVKRRAWPNYLVFFEQLEPTMKAVLHENDRYKECWRGFNTHWHDDWRRKGDVVVWCTK
jgi:phosphatidylinositol glycan class B